MCVSAAIAEDYELSESVGSFGAADESCVPDLLVSD